jgi:LuxR family maltose regulon positive regulatory protein
MPYLGVRSRLQLAKVYSVEGDHATVRHLLREIDDIVSRRPALGALVDAVSELRRIATSSPQGGAAGAPPLTAAELRLLPYLQTHFTSGEIAVRLFVSRSTVNTQISSIYRKLGVSKRSDAVQQATTTGLLGG